MVLVFDSVLSASSSRLNVLFVWLRLADVVKLKSWAPSGTASLTMVIEPTRGLFAYVQVRFSPSLRLIATDVELGVTEPPFAPVTEHEMESKPHPDGIGVSFTV